jgi:hypothetical protein
MLLRRPVLERILTGEVSVQFRRWRRPSVKAGGTQRTQLGVLAIDAVEPVAERDITEADALAAGYPDRAALMADLGYREDEQIYRVTLHHQGDDPRIALRQAADLSDDEVTEIRARLARFDKASPRGPWTGAALALIEAHPARRAPDLAEELGWETQPFKTNVRKLKELGLTESLEVGYRLSPRGQAYLSSRGEP